MKVLVVGVGSRIRGDDEAGPRVCDILNERIGNGESPDFGTIEVIDSDVMPENFSRPIRESRADITVFVDAGDMGVEPGGIRKIPLDKIGATLPSTHTLPLNLFIDHISEDVGETIVLGIQAGSTGLFTEISDEVSDACKRLADMIWNNDLDSIDSA
ncbi:MAG: hydrogenase maturation protease [Thermoplasmatota archaeon]